MAEHDIERTDSAEIHECVVCGASLWYTSGDLCALHEQWRASWRCNVAMMRLQLAVLDGQCSDFSAQSRSHAELQTTAAGRQYAYLMVDWRIYVEDMLRWAWYVLVVERMPWLQDDDDDGDGAAA